MKKLPAILGGAALAAAWGVMGYKGWTWIPIGAPAKEGQIKIACVGDSITYGAMIPNWYRYNYPHVLQKLAGAGYCVHNYGMSGRTAMRTGDHPYVREPRYLRSKVFQPDIVLLKFGTNDSKPQNWLGREEFKKQYREVLESYLNLNSKPRVILLQPAAPHHLHGEEGDVYTFDIQRSKVLEAGEVIWELAEEYELATVDIFALTEKHPDWFVDDGIHPNAIGAQKLAEAVWEAIQLPKK